MNKADLWIETVTGLRVYPFAPRREDFRIEDIAIALGNCCRFAGHVVDHYSVAQHCCIMSGLVPAWCAAEALMHDASEAYMGDVPRPVKRGLAEYAEAENVLQAAIADAFDLIYPWPAHIHDADTRMVVSEGRALGRKVAEWGIDALPYDLPDRVWGSWGSKRAAEEFMAIAESLGLRNRYASEGE